MERRATNDRYAPIYAIVRRVPRGRVSSYGAIAHLAGLPGRARLVGTALKHAPLSARLPWHRIVTASGALAFSVGSAAYRTQRSRLEREGVTFTHDKIDMRRYAWPARTVMLDEILWAPR